MHDNFQQRCYQVRGKKDKKNRKAKKSLGRREWKNLMMNIRASRKGKNPSVSFAYIIVFMSERRRGALMYSISAIFAWTIKNFCLEGSYPWPAWPWFWDMCERIIAYEKLMRNILSLISTYRHIQQGDSFKIATLKKQRRRILSVPSPAHALFQIQKQVSWRQPFVLKYSSWNYATKEAWWNSCLG